MGLRLLTDGPTALGQPGLTLTGEAGGAPVTPFPSVSNVKARFVAGTGVTSASSRVTTWADQSGNGNDASQATTANKPYEAVDTDGLPVVRFVGNSSGVTYMDFASGITWDLRAQTVFMVGRCHRLAGQTMLNMGSTAILRDAGGTLTGMYFAGRIASGKRWTVNKALWGWRSGSGTNALKVYHNIYADTTLATANTGTNAGLRLGATSTPNLPGAFDLYELVACDAAISDADVTAIKNYLVAKYGLPTSDYTKQIMYEGDSIVGGVPESHNGYPMFVHQSDVNAWRVGNAGVSGSTVAIATTRATNYVDSYYEAGYTKNILHVVLGRNDMGSGGLSAATHYDNMKTYLAARVAVGWQCVVGTCIADGGTTLQAKIADYNNLLRGTPGGGTGNGIVADVAGVQALVDYAADSRFDAAADASNTTYYQADGTHPTIVGAQTLAGIAHTYLLTA